MRRGLQFFGLKAGEKVSANGKEAECDDEEQELMQFGRVRVEGSQHWDTLCSIESQWDSMLFQWRTHEDTCKCMGDACKSIGDSYKSIGDICKSTGIHVSLWGYIWA